MANFTVEINRAQGDAVSLLVDKTSPNGLAFTFAFEQANIEKVAAGETEFTDEPDYLKSLLTGILKSWRRQQQNKGVKPAYEAANEATQATVRSTLGL